MTVLDGIETRRNLNLIRLIIQRSSCCRRFSEHKIVQCRGRDGSLFIANLIETNFGTVRVNLRREEKPTSRRQSIFHNVRRSWLDVARLNAVAGGRHHGSRGKKQPTSSFVIFSSRRIVLSPKYPLASPPDT